MKTTSISLQKKDRFEITSQGFLVADANLTRAGVFDYFEDGKLIREHRPPEEVFNKKSLDSLKFAPLTDLHPTEMVNVDNVRRHAIGFVGENIERRGDFVAGKVIIQDKVKIQEILDKFDRGESIELSMGYDTKVVEIAGSDPKEGHFDKTQTEIIYNHASIVPKGRAGRDVKLIMDAEAEASLYLDSEVLDEEHLKEKMEDQERPKQTIIISKETAGTQEAARKIAEEFLNGDEKIIDVEEKEKTFHFRVRQPGRFMEKSFRTFQPKGKEGVSIVFGTLKNSKKDTEVNKVKIQRPAVSKGGFHMDALDVEVGDDTVSVVTRILGKVDEAVTIIEQKDAELVTAKTDAEALQAKLDQAIEENTKLKTDNEELTSPDSPKLREIIQGRADMEAVAKSLGIEVEKDGARKDTVTLRNEIIAAGSADGKFDAEGKSDTYIAARYDAVVEFVNAAKKQDGDAKLGGFVKQAATPPAPKTDAAAEFKKKSAALCTSAE